MVKAPCRGLAPPTPLTSEKAAPEPNAAIILQRHCTPDEKTAELLLEPNAYCAQSTSLVHILYHQDSKSANSKQSNFDYTCRRP